MSERKQQDEDKYVLRMPKGMRGRIKAAAAINNRSMNAEIIAALEKEYGAKFKTQGDLWSFICGKFMPITTRKDAEKMKEEANRLSKESGFHISFDYMDIDGRYLIAADSSEPIE